MIFLEPKIGDEDIVFDLEEGRDSSFDERVGHGEERVRSKEEKNKVKKGSKKKPPRPPRPPKSASLDTTDQKLIREIYEIAQLRRARIERMRALKKMKNAKAASPNSSLFALVVTVVFCVVILWQGVFSRGSSNLQFQGSPESSVQLRSGLISVQFYRDSPGDKLHGSSSASPKSVDQESGLEQPQNEQHLEAGRRNSSNL